ncbi:PhnD/SsuA/transferrin family substrate-binding protein [Thermodesulfobacteriota bacterium]
MNVKQFLNPFFLGRSILTLLVLPIVLLSLGLSTASAKEYDFFYFNPDSSQGNMGHLKREMDEFLSHSPLKISFQPFVHLVDLERKLDEKKPAFVFVPNWYLAGRGSQLGMKPLLLPARQGKQSYSKVLLVGKDSGIDLNRIENRSMAMTSMGIDVQPFLDTILFSRHGVQTENLNIVMVPKDSDALFALVLGQVDAALVTMENLEQLEALNPRLVSGVKKIAETDPISLPVLGYVEGGASVEDLRKFVDYFMQENNDAKKKPIMEMLKIDAWHKSVQ